MAICWIDLLTLMFFKQYVLNYYSDLIHIGNAAFVIGFGAIIYMYFTKRKVANQFKVQKAPWKLYKRIELILYVFFAINFIFCNWNNFNSKPVIPKEIGGYFFWLSLGLIMGFSICKYETNRVLRNIKK